MEKPAAKPKSKIFSFLPKTATVTFQTQPFSPGRENQKLKSNANRGFSGPMISIIPDEARRKSKNGSFDSQEPTSPKVSCMGQIKHKKKVCKAKCGLPTKKEDQKMKTKPPKPNKVLKPSSSSVGVPREDRKLKANIWSTNNNNIKKSSVSDHQLAPSLDQMKRFASGRDTLANFDWKAHDGNGDFDDEEKEEDEVFIAHSAPLMVGGGRVALEPKKEVNLWKRRTMAPPRPLQINVTGKTK